MQYVHHCTWSECMLNLGRQLQRLLHDALLGVFAIDLILGSLGCGHFRVLTASLQCILVVSFLDHMQNVNNEAQHCAGMLTCAQSIMLLAKQAQACV